ncbi:MAG: Sfum_1244 family protein [Thermodesulfobacteriota bacterium]
MTETEWIVENRPSTGHPVFWLTFEPEVIIIREEKGLSGENPSREVQDLARQVTANCHASDADHAGSFSLCGLLLRLRDYYKWENGLEPWSEVPAPAVLAWVEEREKLWEEIQGSRTNPLLWRGRKVDPFDSETLNADLGELGYYYGAGLAAFMKPSFFLGKILEARVLGHFSVVYLGGELARDLFTVPAQTRGRDIIARRRPLAAYLWDTIMYSGSSRKRAADLALRVYGLERPDLAKPPSEWAPRFEKLLDGEIEAFVRHEYGEATDTVFPREDWQVLVGANPHSRLELMARQIKDLLADTSDEGRLGFIIRERRLASLAIYVSLLDGLAALLFPEMVPAFDRFLEDQDWEGIEGARLAARERVRNMAEQFRAMAVQGRDRPQWLAARVEEDFYRPLGL